ncbi:hypothetical protein [Phocaeicola plebeius]|uniref:hypothetical protein n=1 Tax=Phocaeicola plebeius TaxID=310297 RepID=UPI00307A2005
MRRIILCFLLMCNISLWAKTVEQDLLKNDSAKNDSVQTENVFRTDNAYLTVNDIDVIANKVVEKMKQENKEKVVVIAKKISITTGEIIIGILIFIFGVIVGLLYNKIFKKLQKMERQQEGSSRISECRLTSIEKNVAETAKNVEKIKNKVVENVKLVVKEPIAKENSTVENVNKKENRYEAPKESIIYAKPLGNGNLKTTTEASEAIYVISVKKDNTGKFSLYENEDQKKSAIKNKDDMLDLFCNAKGSSIGAKTIQTLNEGEVESLGNDIWKVIKKADIVFIKE